MTQKKKIIKTKIDLPYKRTISARPVIEDVEKATNKFSGGDKNSSTGKYEMILVASARGRDLARGAKPLVAGNYKPAVMALLEIEAGFVGKDYVSELVEKR
jgi:DNA-directed RNA polymerase subunit K/omega